MRGKIERLSSRAPRKESMTAPSSDRDMLEAVARWARAGLGEPAFSRVVDAWTLGKPVTGRLKEQLGGGAVYATSFGDCWVSGPAGPERAALVALPAPSAEARSWWSESAKQQEADDWDTVKSAPRRRGAGRRR